MAAEEILTIGVYGFTSDAFFGALQDARVETLCDLRARRGVRGAEYAFANAKRLEARLVEIGIGYRHFPELATPAHIRARQYQEDASAGVARRERERVSAAFAAAYEALLDEPPARAALEALGRDTRRPALLCVERLPAACHRSLVAARLATDLGVPVRDIVP
jgi:uncharacterized protein (DUF488 family)